MIELSSLSFQQTEDLNVAGLYVVLSIPPLMWSLGACQEYVQTYIMNPLFGKHKFKISILFSWLWVWQCEYVTERVLTVAVCNCEIENRILTCVFALSDISFTRSMAGTSSKALTLMTALYSIVPSINNQWEKRKQDTKTTAAGFHRAATSWISVLPSGNTPTAPRDITTGEWRCLPSFEKEKKKKKQNRIWWTCFSCDLMKSTHTSKLSLPVIWWLIFACHFWRLVIWWLDFACHLICFCLWSDELFLLVIWWLNCVYLWFDDLLLLVIWR